MADSDSTAPKLAEDAQLQKARDILSGMSSRRLDPATIKITETQTGKKGGQGVVVIGTLSPPEALKEWFPELKVAVKKLEWKRDDAEESAKFFKSFVNELALMASLSHPNIVMLVGFVEDMQKGDAWMILPWEANGNVREFLQTGEWDMPERISLIQDTAKGLEYLHHQQPPVCHGDLKSFNILVNSSYRAVITDFGSARIRQSLASEKNENEGAGAPIFEDADTGSIPPKVQFNVSTMELTLTGPKFSLRWTAPEVLNNGIQNLPSDVWALGWVCWEVVTGRIPFEDLNRESVIIVHAINGRLPAIREDAGLSQVLQLCSLISDCWLLDPTKRINVSGFWQKVRKMPSVVPSSYSVGDQKIRSANLLIQLGKTYSLQDDQVMAESYARSALDVANRTKNALAKANALDCLGDIYSAQSKNLEAEEAFMKAHEIYSRLGNDLGAANALEGLGNTYYPQSRHQEAEKAFTEAHEIHSRIGNHMGAANTLLGLGNIYTVHLRYPEAEKAFMEGHKIHSRIGDDRGAANALLGLGNIYVLQSRDQESEKAFTEAYEIYTRIGNHMGVGNALRGLGESYVAQTRVREAEKAFTESHEIHSRIGSHIGVADALFGLGRVYAIQSRCQESEKVLTESYEIHSRIDNHLGAARTLFGLYALYISQSRDQDAERVYAKALEICSHIDNLGSGSQLSSLAMTPSDQRRDSDEEAFNHQAATSSDHAEHGGSKAQTLFALGMDHYTQRRYPQAEGATTEALVISISTGNEECQAHALLLLAQISRSQSRYDEEKAALVQAETIFRRINKHTTHAAILDRLGDVHFEQGTYHEAEEFYRLAQAIFLSIEDVRGEAAELLNLGTLYLRQRRYDEAEECFSCSRVAYAKIVDAEGEVEALEGLMGAHALQRKFVDAMAECAEAREMYGRMGLPMSRICVELWGLLQLEVQPIRSVLAGLFQ